MVFFSFLAVSSGRSWTDTCSDFPLLIVDCFLRIDGGTSRVGGKAVVAVISSSLSGLSSASSGD